ncbi:hypothetical protein CRG98_006987 [Punica granatum]|uniref:Uncharacterized protein n=1 Tax=Punica granatum TaxID=22663 RepID=A0A2I0KW98_PUNGR|nr:hypothetical protein CRG98_006987 [Punica granatum]
MELGLGPQIGGLAPKSIKISVDLGARVTNRRLDPILKVSGVLCGCQPPWWWGWDRRPAAQAPPPFFSNFMIKLQKIEILRRGHTSTVHYALRVVGCDVVDIEG